MFSTWMSQFQSLVRDDVARDGSAETTDAVANPEVERFRRALADLRGEAAEAVDVRDTPPPAATDTEPPAETPEPAIVRAEVAETSEAAAATADEPPAAAPEPAADEPDQDFTAARGLVAQQRQAAEALLREVVALEARLKNEAAASQAARVYDSAKQKADAAATLEQQAKELAAAALDRYNAAVKERDASAKTAAAAKADADNARAQVAALEQQLKKAQQSAQEITATLDRQASAAKEAAAKESAAGQEKAKAAERVSACQAACVAAQKEAQAAKERADALKKQLPDDTKSFAGINDVQSLAVKIANEASALSPGSRNGAAR